jgi:hypothetical protein
LVEALLAEGGIACTLTRLETSEAFAAALEVGGFDLILSDNALPYGLSALARARERCPEVSFIFVYGSGERALDFNAKIAESSTAYLSSARPTRPPCTWHAGNRSGGPPRSKRPAPSRDEEGEHRARLRLLGQHAGLYESEFGIAL